MWKWVTFCCPSLWWMSCFQAKWQNHFLCSFFFRLALNSVHLFFSIPYKRIQVMVIVLALSNFIPSKIRNCVKPTDLVQWWGQLKLLYDFNSKQLFASRSQCLIKLYNEETIHDFNSIKYITINVCRFRRRLLIYRCDCLYWFIHEELVLISMLLQTVLIYCFISVYFYLYISRYS